MLTVLWCFDFPLRLDRHKPLAAGLADGDVARFTEDVLRLVVAHPTKFRQFDAPVLVVYLEPLGHTETLPLSFLLELREVGSLLKEVCVGSFEILQGLLQGLRWHIGQKLVLHFPVGQQGTQSSVAQTHFLFRIAFDVKSEGFVVDEAARPSELSQVAELFAVGAKFEFECLESQHNSVILLVYAIAR